MAKFLADGNISYFLVKTLRKNGFDIKSLSEMKRLGISDKELISIATKEDRIILTHDKDFANLINYPLTPHKGVILLRFANQSPANAAQFIIPLLNSNTKLRNSLTIISEHYIKSISK